MRTWEEPQRACPFQSSGPLVPVEKIICLSYHDDSGVCMAGNELYYGDNLEVLRKSVATETVDLVYLDPPFNSNASYNILFKAPSGERSTAQIEAFEDSWHWNDVAERAFDEVVSGPNSDAAVMLKAMRAALGENDMMAYLAMMAVRLIELHRVLKRTGALYLHCDPTASHYLKILLDATFGPEHFQNEIIWKRTGSHGGSKRWGPLHDTILFYSKSQSFTWNKVFQTYDESYLDNFYRFKDERGRYRLVTLTGAGTRTGDSGKPWRGVDPTASGRHWAVPATALQAAYPDEDLSNRSTQEKLDLLDAAGLVYWPTRGSVPQQKRYADESPGVQVQDIITDIGPISSQSQERLGYPTQKPLALLERIIRASSNEGDLLLDPFCGCGTSIHAAQKLNRRWVGIDITHLAISLIERRLKQAFPGISFSVHGVPTDLAGAKDLSSRDKHEFQKWITSKIGAQPYKGGQKGMDRGIDGYLHFRDADKTPQFAIVSVKGGAITSRDIRDLKGTMERESAAMGIFLTLNSPSREMTREAAASGLYKTGTFTAPRLQILTAEELLEDKRPQVPYGFTEGFKRAEKENTTAQARLL